MAIIQSVGHHIKSLFCLMHLILLVSAFSEKGGLDNFYIRLALMAFPLVMYKGILRRVQMAAKSLFHLMLWFVWVFLLVGQHDLGCSCIRLALLALPFVKSEMTIKMAQIAGKYICLLLPCIRMLARRSWKHMWKWFPCILWFLWLFVLVGQHDLGCSYIRLALLALPFVKIEMTVKLAQTAGKYLCLSLKHMWKWSPCILWGFVLVVTLYLGRCCIRLVVLALPLVMLILMLYCWLI